jgi:thiol-disulfide isomerase/thioredoxin
MLYSLGENMRPFMNRVVVGCLLATAVCAAELPADVRDALAQLERGSMRAPAALGVEFRVRAAEALHAAWPELSQELASRTVAQLRSGTGWRLTPDVMRSLAVLDPDGAISVLPLMQVSYAEAVIDGLRQLHRIDDARSVYRAALIRGARVTAAFRLFIQLLNEKSPQIGDLYRDMLSGFSYDALDPGDAIWIDGELTKSVAEIAHAAAIEGTIRILDAASNPAYGKDADRVTGDFQVGSNLVATTNARDTVLLLAGARLFALSPAEFEKRKALFARWGGVGPVSVKSLSPFFGTPGKSKTMFSAPRNPTQVAAVVGRVEELDEASVADDGLVIGLAAELHRLPPGGGKLQAARRLCEIALCRQVGKPGLAAATSALLLAIRDSQPVLDLDRAVTSFSDDYIRIAEVIRYGNISQPAADPAISAADALLALRERVLEHIGFAVTDLEGKPHIISPVPGKVTLVSLVTNVCARWKARCDRPLPAIEELCKEYEKKGVAVFAIAEEARELFTESLEGEQFTVPLFIDADDKFATVFAVPGRHESILFDRRGKLVARAIGMRTEEQLREMVKKAGVE